MRKQDGFWGFLNTFNLGLSGYLIASVLGESLVKTSENLAEATTRASQSVEQSAELLSETTREAIPKVIMKPSKMFIPVVFAITTLTTTLILAKTPKLNAEPKLNTISQSNLIYEDIPPAPPLPVRPFVVFVNGYQDCCAWRMNKLESRLLAMNAEIIKVPYSDFINGAITCRGIELGRCFTSTDVEFLRKGEDFINNHLDRNRPLILIGHSFGGDSILKLLPRIKRQVQFVAVIDPVTTGGLRLTSRNIPRNVGYFFNRWQTNFSLNPRNLPENITVLPINFRCSKKINCNASICDQDAQNIARNADFSPIRDGRYQKRVTHQGLAEDEYIQKIVGDKIQVELGIITNGFYRQDGKPNVYLVNVNNRAFCHVQSPAQMERFGGFGRVVVFPNDSFKIGLRDAGACY
ncbi:hypothetical protein [Microseira sp. BLCC-F43]|jgi:hypothetical protein|uniref:hypothetical protein n=1 Tax=Microseira sp. BLCC-F43 TaxID=3153602 RepID=UPI0035B99A92